MTTKEETKVNTSALKDQLVNNTNDRYQKLLKEETKKVKGRFRCYETPGGNLRVQQRKFKEEPMFDKTMMDGEVYEVPLYVARYLNGMDGGAHAVNGKIGSCSYPVHGFKWNSNGPMPTSGEGTGPSGEPGIPVPLIGVAKRVQRFGFESLEFGADDHN